MNIVIIYLFILYECHLKQNILPNNSFLLGFRRFIERHGRPENIYSNKWVNLVGNDNDFVILNGTNLFTKVLF